MNSSETITKWAIDSDQSKITFKAKPSMDEYVKGAPETLEGSVYTSANDFAKARIDFRIDLFSPVSGTSAAEDRLHGPFLFKVSNQKLPAFMLNQASRANNESNYQLWGKLTMMGITKNIKLDMTCEEISKDPGGIERTCLALTGKIETNHWGLTWSNLMDTKSSIVGKEVDIECHIQIVNSGQRDLVLELENRL